MVVFFSSFSKKCPLPIIIKADSNMKRGIPTIKDHIERLKLPMKYSSINSAIAIIRMKIITRKTPRNALTMSQICSES